MRVIVAVGADAGSDPGLLLGCVLASRVPLEATLLCVVGRGDQVPRAESAMRVGPGALPACLDRARVLVRVGRPAVEILREIEADGHDLAIVGRFRQSGLSARFGQAEVASRVAEHAPCPVVIAKGRVTGLRRLLLCDSGAPSSSLLSRFVEQLGALVQPEDELTLLHVMSHMEAGPGADADLLRSSACDLMARHEPEGEMLRRDLDLLGRLRVAPRPLVRHGLVADQILAEAREGDYDLVVIGAHACTGWRRLLLDDIAHEIVARVDRPLLVVR